MSEENYKKEWEEVIKTIPEEYKPISMWGYFGYEILFSIPCIGFILLLIFSFGGTKNVNVKNFARSYFCLIILFIVIILILAVIMGVGVGVYNKASNLPISSLDENVILEIGSSTDEEDDKNDINKEIVSIYDVTTGYTGGIAVIKLKELDEDGEYCYNSYLADETGELIAKVGSSDYSVQNGYYINRPGEMDYSYISYKTTNSGTIYPRKTNVAYYCVSENGYALIERKEEALAGDTYYFEIIDQDWNVIYSMEDYKDFNDDIGRWNYYWYGWYFDDIFYITCNSTVTLIDASTGKTIECGDGYGGGAISYEVKSNGKYLKVGNTVITSGLEVLEGVTTDDILNDKYYADDEKIYSIKTEEVAYNFEEGGLDTVYYYDGVYYVLSDTDYLYTMDDDFNIIAEPTKVSDLSNWVYLTLTKYGVVGQMNGVIGFLNENLEFTEKIASISDVGHIDSDMNENSTEAEYLYFTEDYVNCNRVFDLKNMEFVEFWKDAE